MAGLLLAPPAALIALRADTGSAPFWLTALGFVLCVAGPLLVSRYLAEPNYEVILARVPHALPSNWREAHRRYFRFNWIRAVATWTAFALFSAAAYTYWT